MAIIKCPECQNSISSTAKICVHCGCEFLICPECQTSLLGGTEQCPECGYKIETVKEPEVVSKKESEEKETLSSVVTKFENDNIFLKRSIFSVLSTVCICLGMALLAISYFCFSAWKNKSGMEMLLKYESTLNSCKALIIIGIIIGALAMLYERVWKNFYPKCFKNWLYVRKIDITPMLKDELNFDFSTISVKEVGNRAKYLTHAVTSKTLSDDKATSSSLGGILSLIAGVLGFVFAICVMIFSISNLEARMGEIFLYGSKSADFSISDMENWGVLIIGIVLLVIDIILNQMSENAVHKANEEWIKENMPECQENYETHIKNYLKYFVEAKKKK